MAKIRLGFVSNSSSSSFILPITSENDEITIKISIADLKKSFADSDDSRIYGILKTREDVDAHFLDQYGWDEKNIQILLDSDEDLQKSYDEFVEIINSGKSIVVGAVSYHDETMESLLKQMGAKIEN